MEGVLGYLAALLGQSSRRGLLHQAGKGHLARRAAAAATYYIRTTLCSTFTSGVGPEELSGGRERGGPAGACFGLTGGAADRRPA